ncbi:hypothetical protein GWK47_011807 [Chionoecetes opilio]|uniref:Uncharacterized protein n=1 Tax=Chionoecetes opilio TaxID=41210 RepID=A0A8J4XWE4_CHIOP|nr:hypothetical protein GWK47_011807 [Chionoecetes opilio]
MTNRTENLNIPIFPFTGAMASTRKQWWLIGHPKENITGSRLPSKGQVLRKFYFHHGLEKKTKAEAAKETDRGGSPGDLGEGRSPYLHTALQQGEAAQVSGGLRGSSEAQEKSFGNDKDEGGYLSRGP